MTEPGLQIREEPPRQKDIIKLLSELDTSLNDLYPPDQNHLLDLTDLEGPDVIFLVARIDGQAVGIAALRRHPYFGEVKRMYVSPAARGRKVGATLLTAVETQARACGYRLLKLETGPLQKEALGLYRRRGFTSCSAFADYPEEPANLFMEKRLV